MNASDRPQRSEAEAPPLHGLPESERSLLIVDDDAPLCQRLARAMERRGFVVATADSVASGTAAMLEDLGHLAIDVPSGDRALQLLADDSEIDLVITDHAMPGMTGGELALIIKQRWPGLPVALVSGYTELPGELHPDLPRLAKPYRQEELARLMSELVVEPPRPEQPPRRLAVSTAAE